MIHQPYEDWLFADEPLTEAEQAALQEHLKICEGCRQLAAAWQAVEGSLYETPVVEPKPGFTSRWQARLEADASEADRQRLHRRQSLLVLGFSLGAAMLLFGSLAILALPLLESPNVIFWNWVYRLMNLFTLADASQDLFGMLFEAASGLLSPLGWLIVLGVLVEMGVLWIVALRILTQSRRLQKNESQI